VLALVGCQETSSVRSAFHGSEVTAGLDLPFSEVARHGDLLFLSGMIGVEPGTLELVPGGLEAEARRALENVRLMLAAAGATPDDVLRCTVMLDDIEKWSRFNRVYVDFFGDHRPARSALGADGLALGAAVEIQCVASATPGRAPRP
jgi:reactive intermediate/imine deaminase